MSTQGIWDSRQGAELRLGVFLLACLGRDANEKWRGVLQSCARPCLDLRASIPTFCASNCPCSVFSTFHDVLISSRCETRLFNLELEAPLEDIKVALVHGSAHFNMQWKGPRGGILSFDLDRPLPPFQMAATSCGSTAWESPTTTPPADREISRRLQSKQPDDWATSDFTASPSIEAGTIKGTIDAQTRLRPQRSGPHRARTDLPVSIRGPPNKLPGGQDRSVVPLSILLVLVTQPTTPTTWTGHQGAVSSKAACRESILQPQILMLPPQCLIGLAIPALTCQRSNHQRVNCPVAVGA